MTESNDRVDGLHPKVRETRKALAFTVWTALGRDPEAFETEHAAQDWSDTWAEMMKTVRDLAVRRG